MALESYRKKRDFSKTPEPKPSKKPGKGKLYMVHDHRSKNHHFDLRLQFGNILKSWAIPKRIDLKNLHAKRLAVQTEDHPLDYGKWEGKIPEGQYGAGQVKIWDSGSFEVVDWKPGKKLIFRIKGKKLKGVFVLVHFRPAGKEWLFFRKKE